MMPRPFSVTLLAIGVLTLAMVGIVRAWQAILLRDFLTGLGVPPGYLTITGLLAGLAGLPVLWGLWQGLSWAPRLTIGYVTAILVFFWIDRLFIVKSHISNINIPFAMGSSIFIFLFTIGVFYRKIGKTYFT